MTSKSEISWSSETEKIHEEPTKTGWIDVYERERVLDILGAVLSENNKPNDKKLVLEFGASAGYMIEELKQHFPVHEYVATDLLSDGLKLSYDRNPDIMHIQCDFTSAPFKDEVLDVVFSLNVLEHINDDVQVLRECYRVLKQGGYGLFVVPRGEKLYDYFDEMLFHKRRYAKGELNKKITQCGFKIIQDFHFAWLCYPAFFAKKKWNQIAGKNLSREDKMRRVQEDIQNAMASPLAIGLMHLENKFTKIIKPPFGVREMILCKKI